MVIRTTGGGLARHLSKIVHSFDVEMERTKYKRLTLDNRKTIANCIGLGKSVTEIAQILSVHKSTISREIRRLGELQDYRPLKAHKHALEAGSFRKRKIKFTPEIRKKVNFYIAVEQWSPEQISGYCTQNRIPIIGKSRIYEYIHEDKNMGGDLWKHTRHALKKRKRPKLLISPKQLNKKSIEQRDPVVQNKGRIGDWEMDLIVGAHNQDVILTMVERVTGYGMIRKLKHGKNAKKLAILVSKEMKGVARRGLLKTITTDNGTEFSSYEIIEKALKVPVYFAHPYCSTDKPHVELFNKLVRQYIPKKMDFKQISQDMCIKIQHKINRRPRKGLGYLTPSQVLGLT